MDCEHHLCVMPVLVFEPRRLEWLKNELMSSQRCSAFDMSRLVWHISACCQGFHVDSVSARSPWQVCSAKHSLIWVFKTELASGVTV